MPTTIQAPNERPAAQIRGAGDFPEDQFVLIPNVPVFAEHETTDKLGREIRFTQRELQLVADRSNRRIAESGDYAAVCIGHTPSPDAKARGAADPQVVGFAGPFRVGTLGEPGQRQRAAILADFHIFREEVDKLRKYPRRSPELWLEDTYDEMFLDPIALLGAEVARLDLGLLYSAERHGVEIQKYAAVSPGASSVFVPDDDIQYAAVPHNEENLMLSNEELQQIVDAIESTAWAKWCQNKMAEDTPAGVGGGEVATDAPVPTAAEANGPPTPVAEPEPTAAPAAPPAEPVAAAPPAAPPAAEAAGPPAAPAEKEDEEKKAAYQALDELDEKEIEEYMASRRRRYEAEGDADPDNPSSIATGEAEGTTAISAGAADDEDAGSREATSYRRAGEVKQYARQVQQQQQQINDLQKQLRVEQAARVNAQRREKLNELHYGEGFAIDPEIEMERLNYSKMSDSQFIEQIQFIRTNCQRIPFGTLPNDPLATTFAVDRPGGGVEREHYSRSRHANASQAAYREAERLALEGKPVDYESILAKHLEAADNGVATRR